MIAKAKKGKSFGGCVRYVLNEGHEILEAEGVDATDAATITRDFAIQRSCRSEIKQPVGHIAVSFSVDDSPRLTHDFMLQLAHEYMEEMNIRNTQYIVVRHHNTDHDHFHIVYNRIDNDLKLISAHNDYHRSGAATKKIKDRHGLTYGVGKEKVNRAKLKGADRVKYQIHDQIAACLPHCVGYKDLTKRLRQAGITVQFKYRSGADESPENIQGVSFAKGDYKFRGSQIDRRFSHAGLSKAMAANLDEAVRAAMGADYRPKTRMEPEGETTTPTPTVDAPIVVTPTSQPAPGAEVRQPSTPQAPPKPAPTPEVPEVSKPPKPQVIQQKLPLSQPAPIVVTPTVAIPKPAQEPLEPPSPQAPPAPSPADKAKREIREAIEANLSDAVSLTHFDHKLRREGIAIRYKYRNGATETENNIQGISFEKDGLTFKGSDIDRRYSYLNLLETISRNRREWVEARAAKREQQTEEPSKPSERAVQEPAVPEASNRAAQSPMPIPRPTDPPRREQTPPRPTPEGSYATICGVAITAEQEKTLNDGGYIRLEGMDKADGGKFSAWVFRDDEKKTLLYSDLNPDTVVENNGFAIRVRDIEVIKNGSVAHAEMKVRGETELKRRFAWIDPQDGELKYSSIHPRIPKEVQPPPRRRVVRGVELTAEQDKTLDDGGHVWLEGMTKADGSKFSAYVFLSDDRTKRLYSTDHPDRFVTCGHYLMRMRDKVQVGQGHVARAQVKMRGDINSHSCYVWQDADSGEIMTSDTDPLPLIARQEQTRQAQAVPTPTAPVQRSAELSAPKEESGQEREQSDSRFRRPPTVNRSIPQKRTVPPTNKPYKGYKR